MSKNTIPTGAPSHIELIVIAHPHGLSPKEAERRWKGLGNDIVDVKGREITAIAQVEKVVYDHSEAAEGELVWACDYCGAYSRSAKVTEEHEKNCEARNGR